MKDVALAAVPNQQLFIQLEERAYDITVHEAMGSMAISVTRDGEVIVQGMRLTPGTPVFPYPYQEAGNFLLLTDEEALPDWQQFGVTQFLVYATEAEVAEFRAA